MKKLFTIISVLFAVVAMAQTPVRVNYTFANDTINNAETIYFAYPKAISVPASAVFAFTLTEVSGAATIITILQESVQSGKWVDVGTNDTLVVSGTPNEISKIYKITNTDPMFNYRVKVVQTGTAVTKVLGTKFIAR